jgi:hypothetical protein
MSWEPITNGEMEIDKLGKKLSKALGCPIRLAPYSNHAKPIFECMHHRTFPLFALRGAVSSGDWSHVLESHREVS